MSNNCVSANRSGVAQAGRSKIGATTDGGIIKARHVLQAGAVPKKTIGCAGIIVQARIRTKKAVVVRVTSQARAEAEKAVIAAVTVCVPGLQSKEAVLAAYGVAATGVHAKETI